MLHFKGSHFNYFLRALTLCFLVSIFSIVVNGQVYTIDTLLRNGERNNRINLVYLGDGFTSGELSLLQNSAVANNNALFSQNPFQQYKSFFNAYCVKSISPESGAKHPGNAFDEASSNNQPVLATNNLFGSTFDYGFIHRLLVPTNTNKIFQVLAQHIPDYDVVFLVTNSMYYGGSGGVVATASTEGNSTEVAIHEIGHSFAGLADEYWAGDNYAVEKPNMTQNTNPATVKWKNWLNENAVGIYPHGLQGLSASWYKPHQNCKMQALYQPFCSVCTERIVDRIHEMVNMIDEYAPAANAFTLPGDGITQFSVKHLQNSRSSVAPKWFLNGNLIAENEVTVSLPYASFNDGNNIVRVEVTDASSLSKSFFPATGYINIQSWTVNKPTVLAIRLKAFAGKVINSNAALTWEVDNARDLSRFEVEKSADGRIFLNAGLVNGDPLHTSYTFTDGLLNQPHTYYRLKVIEKNGVVFTSSTLRLQNASDKLVYKVYQDADLHRYHLSLRLNNKENVSVIIVNAEGKQVYHKSFGITEQQLEYDVNLQGKPAGVYFMRILVGNNKYTVQILAK